MLSRVANTIYWMTRYVERADNLARLIDVNEQLLLDFESLDSERLSGFWQPIILSTGDESAFSELYDEASSDNVISFLTEDTRNPNSIFSCINFARENARMIRDQISDELWEEINARTVMEFLIYSPDFPRSVRYCIAKINATLHRISGASHGTFSSEAERETGKMLASLSFGDPADVLEIGLHQFLDDVQATLNKIAEEVFATYVQHSAPGAAELPFSEDNWLGDPGLAADKTHPVPRSFWERHPYL